jgi:hypothetical protein
LFDDAGLLLEATIVDEHTERKVVASKEGWIDIYKINSASKLVREGWMNRPGFYGDWVV